MFSPSSLHQPANYPWIKSRHFRFDDSRGSQRLHTLSVRELLWIGELWSKMFDDGHTVSQEIIADLLHRAGEQLKSRQVHNRGHFNRPFPPRWPIAQEQFTRPSEQFGDGYDIRATADLKSPASLKSIGRKVFDSRGGEVQSNQVYRTVRGSRHHRRQRVVTESQRMMDRRQLPH